MTDTDHDPADTATTDEAPKRTRTNWERRLERACLQLEERGKQITVQRVLYPPNPNVAVTIDDSAPRSFDTVRQAAQFLEQGLNWI